MRKLLLFISGIMLAGLSFAQTYPYVDINQISFVSQQDLQNCNDSSAYLGDTITTRGIVVTDGNLSEVSSGSITGGSRPFITLLDTNGTPGPFNGIVVMGADRSNNPVSAIENSLAGDVLELDVIVNEFNGLIQLQPVNSTSVSFVGITSNPAPIVISASDIQDMNRANKLPTGEQWEGSYVELQNMTVVSVSVFSGGSRCEFTVADAAGNQVLVADRFLPMVLNGVQTVNPNSPDTVGSLVPPSVGTVYNYIRGAIFHDENGCAGGGNFAGGYEINPIYATDFDKAASPATVSNVSRNPLVPNATQSVTISADIVDNDGTVTGATVYYTADPSAPANLFQSVAMTNTGGALYTATIPAFPLDSVVRYYIEAIDDSANVTIVPNTPMGAPLNTFFYTVRPNGATIMDIQTVPNVANGDSPYVGDTLTVTGIVTASYQAGDLGYLYIQDPSASEFAGIFVEGGPASTFALNRGDEVTIRGVVESQFGFTKLEALTATATGNTGTITPVVIDPSDAALFGSGSRELERYEGMLVRYENPMAMGRVYVVDANIGFGEYRVGSGAGASVSARVLAGRQSGTSAQSSLDVSYISDTARYGSGLNVTPIQVDTTFNMDALEGMMYYSFGNFKLTPRNNADFIGLVVGIEPIFTSNVETAIFPNPAQDRVNVQISEDYSFNQLRIEVLDMTGRKVVETATSLNLTSINLSDLDKGVYLIRIMDNDDMINSSKLILK